MIEEENNIAYIINNIEKINDDNLKLAILELIKERNELLDSIHIDHLTKVYNRSVLNSIRKFDVVVMCDVDNFKQINDTYGHHAGDEALKYISSIMQNNVRFEDTVCRYGGDEFIIIFTDCDKMVAYNRMKKIQEDIQKCHNINLSISVGISTCHDNKTLFDIIKEADSALYESKENGKNNITIYNCKKLTIER